MRKSNSVWLGLAGWRVVAGLALLPLIGSCSTVLVAGDRSEGVPVGATSKAERASLGIPEGHLPPPGECRIWMPGKPPGHQSPPGPCGRLASRVPVGAWLVHRDANDPDHVEVSVYHRQRPSVVVVIRHYEAESGRFLRESEP